MPCFKHCLPGCLAFLLLSVSLCAGEIFSGFAKGNEGWNIWGGNGKYIAGLGHRSPGCIFLEGTSNAQITMHKQFKGLKPGRYMVIAWLRGFEIQTGQWNYSTWLFYNNGSGIKTAVNNLRGTFEWSRARYTIDVGEKPVDIWYRLKAAGSLWIDDISLTPYNGKNVAFEFSKSEQAFPKPNPVGVGIRCPKCYRWMSDNLKTCYFCGSVLNRSFARIAGDVGKSRLKILMDFEENNETEENKRHYLRSFTKTKATAGQRSAIIKFGRYNNANMAAPAMNNWSGYDYLAMDIYNPLTLNIRFSVAIGDTLSGGYWNQLNHHTTLSPGWNMLKFHVNRFVGERGSVRVKRYLNLKKLVKFWFAVAPEDKRKLQGDFLIDNVRLLQAPLAPEIFTGLRLFDFVAEDFRVQNGFLSILEKNKYHRDIGFGLRNAKIWRSHDSVYADTLNRDGIFVNSGEFVVDLPNGKYIVHLNINHLGLWYEHFWTHRNVKMEGQVVFDESMKTSKAYLANFLRFQDIEPTPQDNAYDLYLTKIFQPIVKEVDVKDGQLNIEFSGDNSGICLNWLVLYPAEKRKAGKKFFVRLAAVQQDEFANLTRQLLPPAKETQNTITEKDLAQGFYSAIISNSKMLHYNQISAPLAAKIDLAGGRGSRPLQTLMVRNLDKQTLLQTVVSPLKSINGNVLKPRADWLRYGVNQYQSHSFNHETFELTPRFLRNFPDSGLSLAGKFSLMLWYQIPLDKETVPGKYTGSVTLVMRGKKVIYPVSLTVYPFTLPGVDIAAGYFGLNPYRAGYTKVSGMSEFLHKQNLKVLAALHLRGFTTWSSFPAVKLIKQANTWKIDSPQLDQLMLKAKTFGFKKVFTYGGGLESVIQVDKRGNISNMPAEIFHKEAAKALQTKFTRLWLPVVYNFSDEASGYSQKVERDLDRALLLKQYYPFLLRGGFSHAIEQGKYGYKLNMEFSDGSYSSMTRELAKTITAHGNRWGMYNQAIGLFQNGRHAFGQGLFAARCQGLDHFIEWYLTGSQNYPYYDLDGRENDAMMLFPRRDGSFAYAIKFEWSAEGMEDYRLLLLLERLVAKAPTKGKEASHWLNENYRKADVFGVKCNLNKIVIPHRLKGKSFRNKIYKLILPLLPGSDNTKKD